MRPQQERFMNRLYAADIGGRCVASVILVRVGPARRAAPNKYLRDEDNFEKTPRAYFFLNVKLIFP